MATRQKWKIALGSAVYLISVALTVQGLTRLISQNFSWTPLLSVSFFLFLIWMSLYQSERSAHAVLGLMALLFVPYYGPLFSSALLLWSFLYPLPEEGKGETGMEEVRVFRLRQPGSLKELLEPEEEESFIPAVTLLKSNDIEERRAAIEVLARIGGQNRFDTSKPV